MSAGSTDTTEDTQVVSRPGTPTWEVAHLYPHQGEWTDRAYLTIRTNHLIEFTDGCLEFLAVPTISHQDIVAYLYNKLNEFVTSHKLGRVYFAPLRIRLRAGKYRQPDVVFLKPHRVQNRETPPNGADLVMEVVSPGEENRERDVDTKRIEYAEAGIPEYWIVDPERGRIIVLTLEDKTYRVHGDFDAGITATSVLLAEFRVAVADALAAGQASDA